MKVSLNTIKQFINFELPPVDELVARINSQLGGVEEVIYIEEKYKDAKIAKVVECERHPNADRLSVCKIDVGTGELVQVVCGAPNVRNGMWAVWLPPESIVPSTFDDAEPFKLSVRELRGVMSNGMLAAGDELAISSDRDGIIEITEADILQGYSLQTGASFSETFGLDDVIIDIENKMFTHRPDLFGQLGVAREIAGILGHKFESPDWYKVLPTFETSEGLELEVFNNATEKVPRILFAAMKNVEVQPSPLWLQCALVAMGSKAINNIVDVTNYVMLLTAQPTHAYDYNKLRGKQIGARMARAGEKLLLLNGKTYELTEDDVVIADSEGAIGLGGVMGGSNSEVSKDTKNIVLEVATFDMYAVRKSSMRHGLFTDAITRFNKGQSPIQNDYIMNMLITSIKGVSPAEQAGKVYDLANRNLARYIESAEGANPQVIKLKFICDRLGVDMKKNDMMRLLSNVEFSLCKDCDRTLDGLDDSLHVRVPFWRTDIHDPEDVVEEVGRLYGFDKLPRELPQRSIKPAPRNNKLVLKQSIRDSLARYGANEVLTYSFVHKNTMNKAEQDVSRAFQISNALSPNLQYYRLSVLPSLLDKVHMNIKSGYDEFVLFEIGKGHDNQYYDDKGLPSEIEFVDAVYTSKKPHKGAAYYHMRKLIVQLAKDLGYTIKLKPVTETLDSLALAPFDKSRSALIETQDGTFIGMIGELKQSIISNFKLPYYTAAMTLDLEGLQDACEASRVGYSPLHKFPGVTQDISLKVAADVKYQDIFWTAWSAIGDDEDIDIKIVPLDIYQAEKDNQKTITLRIHVVSRTHTLTDKEVADMLKEVGEKAAEKHGAVIA